MKKLILLELAFLFLATTFSSSPPPPGWYQQTLPVNDFINDIFFLDSLNGWAAGRDGHIIRTTNGGDNWDVQINSAGNLFSIQFLDGFTGYCLGNGAHGIFYNTTDGGTNWNLLYNFSPAGTFRDMSFINKDTGWVCSNDIFDGGVFKTTNGGFSWNHQLNYASENPQTIFFINNEIGWITNENRKLYKTTNSGINWNLQLNYTNNLASIFFINEDTGWLGSSRILKTTNGGFNWIPSSSQVVGGKLRFISDSIGWGGVNFFLISKTTNGGGTWFYQNSPIVNNTSISATDSLKAWAGATGIVHTTDGGGLTQIVSSSTKQPINFVLYQNYPNPFNPVTVINYRLRNPGYAILKIFDATGKEIQELINAKQNSGDYKVEFNGSNLSSGVYYYRLELIDDKSNQAFSETKKMLLLK